MAAAYGILWSGARKFEGKNVPILDKICCEDKNGPLRVGACGETKWPKHGPLSRSAGYCDIVGAD